ncbi:MAG: TRAP transporter small permease subunit [Rhodocyclaceae bacterium]|nr:TRAP transporter small permease subunit [Rhodocyclaceae bacterium]MCB1891361.1 TRAP transporter small permease subunit [Rhodocyclaceae bacterium]MCW5594592.1 TRAP transporter small permease subunit [Rhodocyclaceae bacterium]
MINRFIYGIDQLNKSVGHAFAWCIIILTFGTSYEVFVRYILNDPTSWAFDLSYIMYGALFIMAGAYTLSRNGHVRGDVIYRLWPERVQAGLDLVLYFLFFFPGVVALVIAGWGYGTDALRLLEVSVNSPIGVPIWPLKMLIPVAGVLLTLQGIAEVLRCVLCLKTGKWPQRLHDVEEMETALMHQREDERKLQAQSARGAAR